MGRLQGWSFLPLLLSQCWPWLLCCLLDSLWGSHKAGGESCTWPLSPRWLFVIKTWFSSRLDTLGRVPQTPCSHWQHRGWLTSSCTAISISLWCLRVQDGLLSKGEPGLEWLKVRKGERHGNHTQMLSSPCASPWNPLSSGPALQPGWASYSSRRGGLQMNKAL